MYPQVEELMEIIVQNNVPIVFTSAGNPKAWTSKLQAEGIKVVHVVSSVKFARKCEEAGVDAVVAEGFEAGGHNGREETTTFCLLPLVADAISIPLLAAGGVGGGKSMLAAMALGAEGVQVGSAFAATKESSAHDNFKSLVVQAMEGSTELMMKQLTPVRLLKNRFYEQVKQAELNCASPDEIRDLLGKGRAKIGMFEGDLDEGELEIGQVAAGISSIKSAKEVLLDIWNEFVAEAKILRGIVNEL
jgi:enoyl-[acyl-carrier protein] reductase II